MRWSIDELFVTFKVLIREIPINQPFRIEYGSMVLLIIPYDVEILRVIVKLMNACMKVQNKEKEEDDET